ncbi:MAG: segregation and condensation protein A [Peptoniphilaceae bacterium]
MEYCINLKAYEGPMELLVDLIKKNEVDIYDIPIHIITNQFLEYIAQAKELNMDLASDFILMASTLLEIKSKMLLPKYTFESNNGEIEDEGDPREDLVNKILEYEKYKLVTEELRKSEEYEKKAFYKLQEDFTHLDESEFLKNLNVDLLYKSIKNIIKRNRENSIVSEINLDEFSIEMANNSLNLRLKVDKEFYFFSLLSDYPSREEIIVYFLAVLELIKLGRINVLQKEDLSDIKVIRRDEFD